jgi:hypothetical protein
MAMNFSATLYLGECECGRERAIKAVVHTHSPTMPKKFKQTLSAYQKGDNSCFVGQKTSVDSGIHATTDHTNVRSLLLNTAKSGKPIQNKWRGLQTYSVIVVLLHDNVRPHTATHTRALQEHFNWELFDHPPYSPDLAPSDCHLFTYTALQQ